MLKHSFSLSYSAMALAAVCGALLLCTIPSAARAAGAALAVPMPTIVVDGDLSDWPAAVRWHEIQRVVAGVHPVDARDYVGSFAVGYNAGESAIYIAIKVRDESIVVDAQEWPQWNSQDGAQVYVQRDGQPVVQYVAYGPFRQVFVEGNILDMAMRAEVQMAVVRGEDGHRYEWRIELEDLNPDTALGFGLSINDVDRDGSYSWFGWRRAITNHTQPGLQLRARLILGAAGTGAHLRGVARWPDGEVVRRGQVAVQQVDGWSVAVPTDVDGQFGIDLPIGRYGVGGEKKRVVDLGAGDTLSAPVVLPYPAGRPVAALLGDGVRIGVGFRRGLWHLLSVADGLPVKVSDMMRDAAGYLWIVGSEIARFDGEELVRLTRGDGQPLGHVTAVAEDGRGDLWFGTRGGGLARWDGGEWTFFKAEDGLGTDVVRDMVVDAKGDLWVATQGGGLVCYDGTRFIRFSSEDGLACDVVQRLAVDRQDAVWMATWGGGVSHYDGTSITTFTRSDGLIDNIAESVYADAEGRVWVGSMGRGLNLYEGGSWRALGAEQGLDISWVRAIHQDRSGALWFSSTRAGIVRWDGTRRWSFDKSDGLASNFISAIAEDGAGRLWFGGIEGGVSRYDGAAVVPFLSAVDAAQDYAVFGLVEDAQGAVWVGTRGGGATRYDHSSIRYLGVEHGLVRPQLRAVLADSRGHLWFGYDKWGISRFDGERWRHWGEGEGIPLDDTICLYEDSRGQIWAGMEKSGLLRYDGAEFRRFTVDDGLASNGVNAMAEDAQGRLLLATSPVSLYDEGRFEVFRTRADEQIEDVYALYSDTAGRMWFGTDRGALCYDGESLTVYTRGDGLVANQVLAITQDARGRMWFGTHGGASVFDGQIFQSLTQRDGLPHNLVQRLLQDRSGDMWIGTLSGAVRYRPSVELPQAIVREVVADRRYSAQNAITFSTLQDIATFHVGAVGVGLYAGVLYRYRLRGLEDAWQTTRESRIEYRDLPSGDYVFEVMAVDQDLNYSSSVEVLLKVHLPYERYAWGAALALALVLIAGQGVRLLRRNAVLVEINRRLQKSDELKSDFVANVSHELRTPLTVIRSSVDNMLDGITGPLNQEQDLYLSRLRLHANRLTRLIDDLLDLSRIEAGQMRLRLAKVSLTRIVQNVVEHLRPLAEEGKVELVCGERGSVREARADADRVYQILFNLINNALKFTPEGGRVAIEVEEVAGAVQVSVRDTGPGIAAHELDRIFDKFYQVDLRGRRGAGIGLSIARNLVELHGGQIWVESEEGKGSSFVFSLAIV